MTPTEAKQYLESRAATDSRARETLGQLWDFLPQTTLERIASNKPISIEFVIDGDFVSLDASYNTFIDKRTGRVRRVKTKLAVNWKAQVSQVAANHKEQLREMKTYSLELRVHGNWLNLDGTVKKRDVANAEKLTADAISKALGFDDSRFWEIHLIKIQSHSPRTVARVVGLEAMEGA